jgi:secondary thiamine-phosphate synthase enzyme
MMRIHSDYMTVQTPQKREFMDITSNVKEAAQKSGIHDGFVLVSSLHSNAAIFVNDGETGLLQDIEEWLNQIAPPRDDYHHGPRSESNASAHLHNLLLHHQVLVSLTDGKLELGPWQQVIYAELDGQRPKRILIKVFGE